MKNHSISAVRASAATVAMVAGFAASAGAQITGPSTTHTPYMVASNPASGVRFISIASNGNGTGGQQAENYGLLDFGTNQPVPGSNYQLLGIVDGMGAYDNGDGTSTLIVNHEIPANGSTTHAHGSRGATISRWIIRNGGTNLNPTALPSNAFQVVGGRDGNLRYNLYNLSSNAYQTFDSSNPMPQYNPGATFGVQGWNFNNPNRDGTGRYCSSDLAKQTAYKWTNPANGQIFGTDDKIYMNGEEIGAGGRAFAHVITGNDANSAWELPRLGRASWENQVANPFSQQKTVVMGLDDSGTGGLYMYVGSKQNSGNAIQRAGLTNGNLYGLTVPGIFVNGSGQPSETRANVLGSTSAVTSARFGMYAFGDVTSTPGSTIGPTPGIQQIGDQNGVVNFLRPEDGAWDEANPRDFYFVTTDTTTASGGRSRLWRSRFDDIANPEQGGQISMLLDSGLAAGGAAGGLASASGATTFEMADNMTVVNGRDGVTRILMQEDVGGNPRLGRLWLFDTSLNALEEIGISDSKYFVSGATNFLTQDEETSGIIPAPWLGDGWFLLNMQAHYPISGELVEGSQLMAVFIPQTIPAPGAAAVIGLGGLALARRRRRA
jgi:hypothetical protein